MDRTLLMSDKGFCDLLGNQQSLVHWDRSLCSGVGKSWFLHQLQHQRTSVLGFLPVHSGSAGMVQAGEDLRLSQLFTRTFQVDRDVTLSSSADMGRLAMPPLEKLGRPN